MLTFKDSIIEHKKHRKLVKSAQILEAHQEHQDAPELLIRTVEAFIDFTYKALNFFTASDDKKFEFLANSG